MAEKTIVQMSLGSHSPVLDLKERVKNQGQKSWNFIKNDEVSMLDESSRAWLQSISTLLQAGFANSHNGRVSSKTAISKESFQVSHNITKHFHDWENTSFTFLYDKRRFLHLFTLRLCRLRLPSLCSVVLLIAWVFFSLQWRWPRCSQATSTYMKTLSFGRGLRVFLS